MECPKCGVEIEGELANKSWALEYSCDECGLRYEGDEWDGIDKWVDKDGKEVKYEL